MKTFKEFQKHASALSHIIFDPITKRKIRVPKGHSIPVSRSSSKGGGSGDDGE